MADDVIPPGKRRCRLCHELIDDDDDFAELHEMSLDPASRRDREERVDAAVRAEAEASRRHFPNLAKMRF